MSWSIFKQEMKAKMVNSSFKSTNEFADFFTQKYDQCMKRGLDVTTQNTVIKGNTELMRSTILYALEVGLNSKTPAFYNQSIALLGKGAVAYWSGVELGKIPPLIPAPGTILNLSVVTNTATNPGTWPPAPFPVFPSTSNDPYLDAFILQATIHLQTVSGVCNTISQYPPTAPPGPGILPWVGFNVEVSPTSQPATTNAEEIIQPKMELTAKDFIISDEQLEYEIQQLQGATDEFMQLDAQSKNNQAPNAFELYLRQQITKEFIDYTDTKIKTKENTSIDAHIDDVVKKTDDSIPEYVLKCIENARKDIGIKENLGPNDSIRIRQMLLNVGYDTPALWCGAAVTTWWKSAGIKTPTGMRGSSTIEWEKWGRQNNLFTNKPVPGAAIIYADSTGKPTHMGMVESYDEKTGFITTIEGNASSTSNSRNGDGVYRKKTSLKLRQKRIVGYVLPSPKK